MDRNTESVEKTIKVVYVIGMGRSGSTILGNALGQLQGVCHVGELRNLWRSGYLRGGLCGCGKKVVECDFWVAVVDDAICGEKLSAARRLDELQMTTVRTRRVPRALLHLMGWRCGDYDEYARALDAHYRAIVRQGSASVIIDSSKHPTDLLLISQLTGIELFVLHLIRDPRGVAYSWASEKVIPGQGLMRTYRPTKVALEWSLRAFVDGLQAIGPGDHYRRVRYEDFAQDPVSTIERINQWVSEPKKRMPIGESSNTLVLAPTHTASGNPNRHEYGEFVIAPDERWRHSMTRWNYVMATIPALPMLWIQGYRALRPRAIGRSIGGSS